MLLLITFLSFKTFIPCLSGPCLNNGTCSAYSNATIRCNCSNCYSGAFCQIPDYCCLNVCSPNGVCISGLNGTYTCICQPNYVGANCSIYNPCALLPCQNSGKFMKKRKKLKEYILILRYLCYCKWNKLSMFMSNRMDRC